MELSNDRLIEMFTRMTRIREFDERAGHLTEEAKVVGSVHLYVGEEASGVGVCATLNDDDYITSTHRGHGHLLAKGGDMKKMFAELYAKSTGYCHGKGGSMHMSDLDLGILGANGILGAGAPIAAGAGFACKHRDRGQVTVCFFGDGAASEGAVHEAMNLAATWKLPVIFVCENNLYGEFMAYSSQHAIDDVSDIAQGYGMPGVAVDGQDVLAVFEAASEAVARARRGDGPSFIETKTYRYYDHVGRDYGAVPRPEEEVNYWKSRDPIDIFRATLIERGVLTGDSADAITQSVRDEVEAAIKFAEESPEPEVSALLEDVYTEVTA